MHGTLPASPSVCQTVVMMPGAPILDHAVAQPGYGVSRVGMVVKSHPGYQLSDFSTEVADVTLNLLCNSGWLWSNWDSRYASAGLDKLPSLFPSPCAALGVNSEPHTWRQVAYY